MRIASPGSRKTATSWSSTLVAPGPVTMSSGLTGVRGEKFLSGSATIRRLNPLVPEVRDSGVQATTT